MSGNEEASPEDQTNTPPWQVAIGLAVLAALSTAAILAVIQIYPHKLTTPASPSFVDTIFDSRVVILLVRVALMFAAGYVVISVVELIIGRRWLSELGPFKASEPIARLNRSAEALERDLGDAVETIEGLEDRLVESDEALARARADIASLLRHVDTMEGKKEGN